MSTFRRILEDTFYGLTAQAERTELALQGYGEAFDKYVEKLRAKGEKLFVHVTFDSNQYVIKLGARAEARERTIHSTKSHDFARAAEEILAALDGDMKAHGIVPTSPSIASKSFKLASLTQRFLLG